MILFVDLLEGENDFSDRGAEGENDFSDRGMVPAWYLGIWHGIWH
jgi:hypothetical protein